MERTGTSTTARAGRLVAVAAALFVGCSSQRPPTAKVGVADVAVREAEEAQAGVHAPLEMRLAREKLEKARRAIEDEDYADARRFAEQAYVDAQLAEARARSAAAKAQAREVQRTVDALREEAYRGPRPPQ